MKLLQKYKNSNVERIVNLAKTKLSQLRYVRLVVKRRNKHKVIAVGYAGAIAIAFILSLTNNSNVNASIAPTDSINYIILENTLDDSLQQNEVAPSLYPQKSIENIRSLQDMVAVQEKEQHIEKELVVQKGDTFISLLRSEHTIFNLVVSDNILNIFANSSILFNSIFCFLLFIF